MKRTNKYLSSCVWQIFIGSLRYTTTNTKQWMYITKPWSILYRKKCKISASDCTSTIYSASCIIFKPNWLIILGYKYVYSVMIKTPWAWPLNHQFTHASDIFLCACFKHDLTPRGFQEVTNEYEVCIHLKVNSTTTSHINGCPNLRQDANHPCSFLWFFSAPTCKCYDSTLNHSTNTSLNIAKGNSINSLVWFVSLHLEPNSLYILSFLSIHLPTPV